MESSIGVGLPPDRDSRRQQGRWRLQCRRTYPLLYKCVRTNCGVVRRGPHVGSLRGDRRPEKTLTSVLTLKCATARSICASTKETPFRSRRASGFSSSGVSGPASIAVVKQLGFCKVSQKRANSILAHHDPQLNSLKRLVARPRLELGTYGL